MIKPKQVFTNGYVSLYTIAFHKLHLDCRCFYFAFTIVILPQFLFLGIAKLSWCCSNFFCRPDDQKHTLGWNSKFSSFLSNGLGNGNVWKASARFLSPVIFVRYSHLWTGSPATDSGSPASQNRRRYDSPGLNKSLFSKAVSREVIYTVKMI